jgi:hypothetical protein
MLLSDNVQFNMKSLAARKELDIPVLESIIANYVLKVILPPELVENKRGSPVYVVESIFKELGLDVKSAWSEVVQMINPWLESLPARNWEYSTYIRDGITRSRKGKILAEHW